MEIFKSFCNLADKIEKRKKFLFVIQEKNNLIGIDVLDYDTEDAIDGGWYNVDEARKLLLYYFEESK